MTELNGPLFRRVSTLATLGLTGFLIALAASSLGPPGPRLAAKRDLVGLIESEDRRTREMRARLDELQDEFDAMKSSVRDREGRLAALRHSLAALAPGAGLTAVTGPGVTVELRDSTLRSSPTGNPNDLVIHEEDLQAIVNGLWGAGAEALSVNGERVTSGSAIRCVGNTLLLHGNVYSPPYRISAIGDTERLEAAMTHDPLVRQFRVLAEEFRLGFDVARAPALTLPAFRGLSVARFARPDY